MTAEMTQQLAILFQEKYRTYCNRVRRRVGSRENAEDVVQEAFCRAFKYVHQPGIEDLERWFVTILNNAARDFKRQERLDGMGTREEEEGTDEADVTYFREEMLERIQEEIDKKHEPLKSVLHCALILGWKPREIREFSPMKYDDIRQHISRFRRRMQRKYGEDMCW